MRRNVAVESSMAVPPEPEPNKKGPPKRPLSVFAKLVRL